MAEPDADISLQSGNANAQFASLIDEALTEVLGEVVDPASLAAASKKVAAMIGETLKEEAVEQAAADEENGIADDSAEETGPSQDYDESVRPRKRKKQKNAGAGTPIIIDPNQAIDEFGQPPVPAGEEPDEEQNIEDVAQPDQTSPSTPPAPGSQEPTFGKEDVTPATPGVADAGEDQLEKSKPEGKKEPGGQEEPADHGGESEKKTEAPSGAPEEENRPPGQGPAAFDQVQGQEPVRPLAGSDEAPSSPGQPQPEGEPTGGDAGEEEEETSTDQTTERGAATQSFNRVIRHRKRINEIDTNIKRLSEEKKRLAKESKKNDSKITPLLLKDKVLIGRIRALQLAVSAVVLLAIIAFATIIFAIIPVAQGLLAWIPSLVARIAKAKLEQKQLKEALEPLLKARKDLAKRTKEINNQLGALSAERTRLINQGLLERTKKGTQPEQT
ncbi:MAG: hypothetical protein COU35_02620 [Candidatus Magasanikbacteria bacterium CG10_big_fil_rev_8_21_14_0_10_47_10]|uniref:Uncharacterized protein n=1 Tax=Candidatus Magasanikbacteria bacterium CG10_big_fil_rev_8_21_14_0_10_47_10 TaxID=1974652 RepID=A0A2H0TQM9_9BACT|nr:MAG: hypothetical protein COU35_02620 [Candidatus Magasanikbacteria bacterium CG10_big_fil_rev_8_21_14_0_10_47_10]